MLIEKKICLKRNVSVLKEICAQLWFLYLYTMQKEKAQFWLERCIY